MNKIYDKLLLAIAALLLAGGVFIYLQKTGDVPTLSAPADVQPAGNPYQPEAVPSSLNTDGNWPSPKVQSTGWLYDVFTPPRIFIDENGQFSAEGWTPPPPPVPFGVYLVAIDREPYRIQLEGYIEEDRSDPLKTLLLMFDEEAQKQVRLRPGNANAEAEFELLSFDIERIRDGDNNIEVVGKAIILDQRSGEEVILIHGERLYDSGVTVKIGSKEDPSYEVVLTDTPAEFEGPLGKYILQEINLEESTVTAEKQASEDEEAEVRTLKVRSAGSSTPQTQTPEVETNQDPDNVFDLMF